MTIDERITALEARLAAAEARIAALERTPAPISQQPYMPFMPPCNPPPGWPWHEVTCGMGSIPAPTIKPLGPAA